MGYRCLTPHSTQQYFSYIVIVIFLAEETGVLRENHWPAASHWQTLSYKFVSSTNILKTRGSALSWACVAHLSFCFEET
jgi:hypothetical protein